MEGLVQPRNLEVGPLPIDTWLELVHELNAQDVWSLSQTCYHLFNALDTRAVWLVIFRRFCRRYQLFLPSYPIDTMSTAEFRRACAGPHRWSKMIARNSLPIASIVEANSSESLPTIRPLNTTILPQISTRPERPWALVPGGRYLFTERFAAGKSDVILYDLGIPMHMHPGAVAPPPKVIAEIPGERGDDPWWFRLALDSGTGEVLNVALVHIYFPVGLRVSVYSIALKKGEAQVIQRGEIRLPAGLGQTSGTADKCNGLHIRGSRVLILIGDSCFILWDFMQGQYMAWTSISERHGMYSVSPVLALTDGLVVCARRKGLDIWTPPGSDDPRWLPLPTTRFPTDEGPNRHFIALDIHLEIASHISFLLPRQSRSLPFTFDAFCMFHNADADQGWTFDMHRYVLQRRRGSDALDLTLTATFLLPEAGTPYMPTIPEPPLLCPTMGYESSLVIRLIDITNRLQPVSTHASRPSAGTYGFYSIRGSDASGPGQGALMLAKLYHPVQLASTLLCIASGRSVYERAREGDESGEWVIDDFC